MCLHFFTELSKIMKLNMDWVWISTYFPYVPFEILNGTNFCMLVTKHSAGCCVCPFESQHSARISLSSFNARTTPQILSNIHQLDNRIIFVHCHFWVWSATFFLLLVSRLMPLKVIEGDLNEHDRIVGELCAWDNEGLSEFDWFRSQK